MDDEVAARAALCAVASLSRAQARRLIETLGSARAALGASPGQLGAVLGARPRGESLARALDPDRARRTLARAVDAGMRVLAPDAAEFPAALREIPDPPLLLWVRGALPRGPTLAMVGSRRPSARAAACARAFASELARSGVAIVSGLAYGIDAASHEGALAGQGATVAVLASGLEHVTPPGQRGLAERILAGGGAWLSERWPDADAAARHFPERNRLISGLARVTLVVEAREKSGSLWSARHALEQGRDVAIVPGPIDTDQCRGSNGLLRDGALPILDADDLRAAVLGPLARKPAAAAAEPAVSPAARALLAHLAEGACDLDQLCRSLGRSPRELAPVLLELELDGRISREGTRVAVARPSERAERG
ncbi:MAG TPA: DNA-processing protein DprA [Myxococcota bacterium]|nr:DNA-processing protein DprA [Myxococcota bacterium]